MSTIRHQLVSPLQLVVLATAGIILLPLGYVTAQALSADPAVWSRLWATRIPELLFNTVSLAASVAVITLVLGVSTAWLVTRVEFPGRRLWEGALVLPLAMPTYVLAYVYSYLLGFGGPVEHLWQLVAGPQARIFSPHSYLGRDTRDGIGYVSLRLSPEPQCPPQYERVVRRGGTGQRRLSSLDPLARDAAADASLDCRRSRARHLVRRVGLRCGVIASLPDTHLCRVPADDWTVRQYRGKHLEPPAGRCSR